MAKDPEGMWAFKFKRLDVNVYQTIAKGVSNFTKPLENPRQENYTMFLLPSSYK